jgi:hypothetical protein
MSSKWTNLLATYSWKHQEYWILAVQCRLKSCFTALILNGCSLKYYFVLWAEEVYSPLWRGNWHNDFLGFASIQAPVLSNLLPVRHQYCPICFQSGTSIVQFDSIQAPVLSNLLPVRHQYCPIWFHSGTSIVQFASSQAPVLFNFSSFKIVTFSYFLVYCFRCIRIHFFTHTHVCTHTGMHTVTCCARLTYNTLLNAHLACQGL